MTRVNLRRPATSRFLTSGKPKLARLALVRGEKPHISSVWYMWRDGCFWYSTAEDRLKVKIIKENPHVALIIDTDTRPYKGVIIEGLAELTKSKLSEITLKIVERYVSKKDVKKQFETLMRASRVLIRIRPKKALDIMSYRRH